MQNCLKLFLATFFGKNGSYFIVDSKATIQSKYLIFEPIKLTITGFKMMPKSNLCGSSILGYSRLKMMKTMRALKSLWNLCCFVKTLHLLHFYHCVHEIFTEYNYISCHYMYEILDKSDDIFNYLLKAKLRQIILAKPVCHVRFRHMHHIWYNSNCPKTAWFMYLIFCIKNCSRLGFNLPFTELFYLF